ncbi:MAG: hypothetical protein R3C11_11050 [Planctomycetaceae bacterium]
MNLIFRKVLPAISLLFCSGWIFPGLLLAEDGHLISELQSDLSRPAQQATVPDVPAADGLEENLLDLDIEELGRVDVVVKSFDVEVTTVTKESTVGKTPAAVFINHPGNDPP